MSDMPRVIHANEKLTSVVDMRIVADVMNPTVSAQYTSYKRTDTVVDKTLVDKLIEAINRRSSKSWLCVICGGDFPSHDDGCPVAALEAIQGEGK